MAVVREKYWSGQSLTGRTGDYGLAFNNNLQSWQDFADFIIIILLSSYN